MTNKQKHKEQVLQSQATFKAPPTSIRNSSTAEVLYNIAWIKVFACMSFPFFWLSLYLIWAFRFWPVAMGRAPCCDKDNVKKGPWCPEEDATLKEYLEKNGTGGNWIALPRKAGLSIHVLVSCIWKLSFKIHFLSYLFFPLSEKLAYNHYPIQL